MASQLLISPPDVSAAEVVPPGPIHTVATPKPAVENTAAAVHEVANTTTDIQASASARPVANVVLQQNQDPDDDDDQTEPGNDSNNTGRKRSKVRRVTEAIFTTTNLLIASIGVAFAIVCYRYVKWTALKDFREDCRATAASGQNITAACSTALLGSMPPPPFRLSSAEAHCGDYDAALFQEFLRSETDGLFPLLWQYLLFEMRYIPSRELMFTATMLLPTYLLTLYLFVLFSCRDLNFTPKSAIQASTWLFSYHVIGMTGIWLMLSSWILSGIQWVSLPETQVEWSHAMKVGLAVASSYDIVKVIVFGCVAAFAVSRPIPPSVTRRFRFLQQYGTFTSNIVEHKGDRSSTWLDLFTSPVGIIAMSVIFTVPVFIWHSITIEARIWILYGIKIAIAWVVIPLGIHLHGVKDVEYGLLRNTIGFLGFSAVLYGIDFCAGWLAGSYVDPSSSAETFWTQYFCQKGRQRDLRSNLLPQLDAVFQQEQITIGFNATALKMWRYNPDYGHVITPDIWQQVRSFVQRIGEIDLEEWRWLADEL